MLPSFVLAQIAPATTSAPANAAEIAPGSTSQPASQPTPPPKQDQGSGLGMLFYIPLIGVALYLLLKRPNDKAAKAQDAMLKALKRGDRVVTIGGLIGSVVEVRGEEVVLKVDESNNVKERYIRSAIKSVLVDGDKADKPDENKK